MWYIALRLSLRERERKNPNLSWVLQALGTAAANVETVSIRSPIDVERKKYGGTPNDKIFPVPIGHESYGGGSIPRKRV